MWCSGDGFIRSSFFYLFCTIIYLLYINEQLPLSSGFVFVLQWCILGAHYSIPPVGV